MLNSFHPGEIFMLFFCSLTTIVTMILADNIKMVKKLQKIFYSSQCVLAQGFVLYVVYGLGIMA